MLRKLLLSALVTGVCLAASATEKVWAADEVKLHMSALSVESMPYLIAQDLGFYDKHNIKLDRRNMKVTSASWPLFPVRSMLRKSSDCRCAVLLSAARICRS